MPGRAAPRKPRAARAQQGAPPPVSEHITYESGAVTLAERELRNGQKAAVVWLTGLWCSRRSTVSQALEKKLFDEGMQVTRLDGDNVRHGLSSELGFSIEDRREIIRCVAHAAKLIPGGASTRSTPLPT